MADTAFIDKIKGALFGLAIGDALGAATEFMTPEEIRMKYGYLTEMTAKHPWNKGETTDDTAMTLAVARGILDDAEDPIPCIGERLLQWAETHPKDVGITIRATFRAYRGDWFATAEQVHNELDGKSAGNGSLMRCLPIALVYDDMDTIAWYTRLQSTMTHFDEEATKACLLYNRIAYRVLNGEDLHRTILDEIAGTAYTSVGSQKPDCVPDGYVVHTLTWVLWILLNYESYEEVVQIATNAGYDSDTVAAIAGGLAGLQCGFEALPKNYVQDLIDVDEIDEVCLRLTDLRRILKERAQK